MCGNSIISWRFIKQILVVTSSNHVEILAMHEASRECMWLRSMINIFVEHMVYKQRNSNHTI